MKTQNKEVLFGLYDDDDDLLKAVKKAKAADLNIMDVFTPFPVHGLDPALGLAESRIHITGFVFGALGTLTALLGITWIVTSDWPIIFGGKPYWSFPSFVPIIFELTVLFASIGMVVTFFVICGMGFGVTNPVLDDRITDDKFCLAFQTNGRSKKEIDKLKSFFKKTGASEVNSKVI